MNLSSLSNRSRSMPTTDAVVRDAEKEIAALGVQEGRNRFQGGVGHAVVLAVLLEVPAQGRLELQRLGLAPLDQFLGVPVATQVLVEEEGLHEFAERVVVGDSFVEVEVRVDDVLDHLLDLVVESEAHVLAGVDADGRSERRIVLQLVHHLV